MATGIAAALGLGAWLRNRPQDLERLPNALGFQRFSSGSIGSNFDPFVGIDAKSDPLASSQMQIQSVREAPCPVLFGSTISQPIPIAVFTDYNCPVCRRFDPDIEAFAAERNAQINWLDLPRLGPSSVLAATLALAAEFQDAENAMRDALSRSRVVASPAFAGSMAERLNLDADRLLLDMQSEPVTERLQNIAALAQALGIPATPSFAIRGTVVIGAVTQAGLQRLADTAIAPPCEGAG